MNARKNGVMIMLPESLDPEVRSHATVAFLHDPSPRTLATIHHLASVPRWSAFLRHAGSDENTSPLFLVNCSPSEPLAALDLMEVEEAVRNIAGVAWGRRTIDPFWNAEGRLAIDNSPPRASMLFDRCGVVVTALSRGHQGRRVVVSKLERGIIGTALAWENVFGPVAGEGPAYLDVSLVSAKGFTVERHPMDGVSKVDRPHIHMTFELPRSEERIDRRLRPLMDVLAQALGKSMTAGYDDGGWRRWDQDFGWIPTEAMES